MDQILQWVERLGLPTAILIAIYLGIAKLCRWAMPHVDQWIAAKVKAKEAEAERHKSTAEALTKIVDKTIEIQEHTRDVAEKIQEKVPEVCKWKPKQT